MGKLIELFKKKKVPEAPSYEDRTKACVGVYKATGVPCKCATCKDKRIIIDRLIKVSNYLCLDYISKTGNTLYFGDWHEIMVAAAIKVEDIVYPQM